MKTLTTLFLFLSIFYLQAQDNRIIVEGKFTDWDNLPIEYDDPDFDGAFGSVDFKDLQIFHDEKYLFLKINVGKEINLQEGNDVTVYIDGDDDPSTGTQYYGIGAEIVYNFGTKNGLISMNGSTFAIGHDAIGVVTAPTVSSDVFEIAISREKTLFSQELLSFGTIKVVFRDDFPGGDILPEEEGGVAYTFTEDPLPELPGFELKNEESDAFRVVSYNVLGDSFFEFSTFGKYSRILQALEPDIIAFQEIYDHSPLETAQRVELILPSSAGEQWYHAGVEPDIILVSRYPIVGTYEIDGAGSGHNGAFLVDMGSPFNSKVLILNAHPPCCANNVDRQIEVDAMMAFIRDAKAGIGPLELDPETPIIIAGDMNLVGFKEQLETFITGDIQNEGSFGSDFEPDWNGDNFVDPTPLTTGLALTYTWFNPFSSFSPGRLDFIFYSGSVLEAINSFTLFTPALSFTYLSENNLQKDDTPDASDHQPVVVDFKLKEFVSVEEVVDNQYGIKIEKLYPNPFDNWLKLAYSLPEKLDLEWSLVDLSGRQLEILFKGEKQAGSHVLELETFNLSSGSYFLQLKVDDKVILSKKVIK